MGDAGECQTKNKQDYDGDEGEGAFVMLKGCCNPGLWDRHCVC